MIHWTPEGATFKVGLNFYATRWYWRVVWRWYDMPLRQVSGWYLRFSIKFSPHWIWERNPPRFVIEEYCKDYGYIVLTKEQALDIGVRETASFSTVGEAT